jgi:hypothetical protein
LIKVLISRKIKTWSHAWFALVQFCCLLQIFF